MAGCLSTDQATTTTSTAHQIWRVVEVIDGDTLVVENHETTATVRLASVNAPEHDECGADDATSWLRSFEGETVSLQVTGRDRFDRVLAHLEAGGLHVNRELVEDGLALATTPDVDDPYGTDLLAVEEQAYQEGLGIWAADACGSAGEPPALAIDRERSVPDAPGPDGDVLASEVIVISNPGTLPVDLSGWMLRDESSLHRFHFGSGTTLPAGASTAVSSADPGWEPGGSPVWNNDGDLVLLQDPAGTVASRWRY